jgi:hypothetical protein
MARGHLYRKHQQPIRCPRCCSAFLSIKARDLHITDDGPCERRDIGDFDTLTFTPQQEQQLRSRENLKGKPQDVRWRDIYRILFPDVDDDDIPNPCKPLTNRTEIVLTLLDIDVFSAKTMKELDDCKKFVIAELPGALAEISLPEKDNSLSKLLMLYETAG